MPVLLVTGEHGLLGAGEVRRVRTRPGVRHVVLSGAGHDVHLERPRETADLVVDFLAVSGG